MRLNLREIIEVPGRSIPFDCDIHSENLDFESVKCYESPLHASGLVFNEAGILRLTGEVSADMVCICDRCGAEFNSSKTTELDAVITEEESEENPELFTLDGDELDLDELISTCFILDMETKFLCREDCKGICSGCGVNLNVGTCTCRKQIDPRFAVLEQLLDKD